MNDSIHIDNWEVLPSLQFACAIPLGNQRNNSFDGVHAFSLGRDHRRSHIWWEASEEALSPLHASI